MYTIGPTRYLVLTMVPRNIVDGLTCLGLRLIIRSIEGNTAEKKVTTTAVPGYQIIRPSVSPSSPRAAEAGSVPELRTYNAWTYPTRTPLHTIAVQY